MTKHTPIPIPFQLPPASDDVLHVPASANLTAIDRIDSDLSVLHIHARMMHRYVYAYVVLDKKYLYLHRIIMERILGRRLRSNEMIDHIDCNALNNCRSNLRLATASQNGLNSRRSSANKTGYKGVYKVGGRYRARITVRGVNHYLGSFATAPEAHAAYERKAIELAGEFARAK